MQTLEFEKIIKLVEGVSSTQNGLQQAFLKLTDALKVKFEEINETFELLSQKVDKLEKRISELEKQ